MEGRRSRVSQTRDWVERDVNTTGWQVRRLAQVWVGIVFGMAIIGPLITRMSWQEWQAYTPGLLIGAALGGAVAGVLQATLLADYLRRRTLAYYRKKSTAQGLTWKPS